MSIVRLIAREHAVHFELDKETLILSSSDGHRWKLGNSECAVLSRLARTPNVPVKTEELLDEGWKHPDRKLESVARSVADLRKKLGDNKPVKRFIETIPNFGYELIAECEHREGPAAPLPIGALPAGRAAEPVSPPILEQSEEAIRRADPEDIAFTEFTVKLSDTWPSFLKWLARRLPNMTLASIREDEGRANSFYHSGRPGHMCYPIEVVCEKGGVPITQRIDLVSEWLHPFVLDLAGDQTGIPWDTSLFPVKATGTEGESRIDDPLGHLRDAEYWVLFAARRSRSRAGICRATLL